MKLKEWVVIYVAVFLGDWLKGRWKKEDNECW